jgi:integrase
LTPPKRGKDEWFFCAAPSKKYPDGGHFINYKRLNEHFLELLKKLGIPAGRFTGFTVHSLRGFFKTHCLNSRIPKPVVDNWQDHAEPQTASSTYYNLSDEESQRFMKEVPFGTGKPAADAGDKEVEP